MNKPMSKLLITLIVVFGLGSNAYAGCGKAKLTGPWDITFSDGNTCVLRFTSSGEVNVDKSICYDPFLGATAPDSGSFATTKECTITVSFVQQGVAIEMSGQFSLDRNLASGGYVLPDFAIKGSFTMIRLP